MRVSELVESIIKNEIKPALLTENPECKQYINSIASSFIKRCRASFKDKCSRVGRDPMRKLQYGERIIGTIHLAKKHGLNTRGLEFGAACAIMYSILSIDETDKEALKIKELYEKRFSISDVLTYNGEYNKTKYAGLDASKDSELITSIQEYFNDLKNDLKTKN